MRDVPELATAGSAVAEGAKGGTAPSAGQSHVQSLDGVRFFAFFGVFVFHALQNNATLAPWAAHGALGVQIFFVLSGFLIGDILLSLRDRASVPLGQRLRTFYVRRALRIFPLYYLVLALIALLPSIGITVIGGRDVLIWNATYLTNVAMYLGHGMMIHAPSPGENVQVVSMYYWILPNFYTRV